ncbi:MAG: hypothetical protein GF398_18280 [Chitinivibrionales bacterium]|nr:hypothetical protein [Chitinivibrionales bacterium]
MRLRGCYCGFYSIFALQAPQLFADELVKLLENKEKRESMGNAGWERIDNKLGWPKQKENLIKAYSILFPDGAF